MSICGKLLPRKAANSGLSQTIQQYAFLPIGYTFEKTHAVRVDIKWGDYYIVIMSKNIMFERPAVVLYR